MPASLDVVAIPDTPWDRIVWTNRQQIMLRLPQVDPGVRVLYVAPPRLAGRRLDAPGGARPSLWTTPVAERVWVVQPLLPLPHRVVRQLASDRVDRLMLTVARHAARRLGFSSPCVWSYTPLYASHVGAFDERCLVYDVVNDYAAMPYYHRVLGPTAAELDQRLTTRADLVFVVDDSLLEQRRAWNDRCHLVGNAGDVDGFAAVREWERGRSEAAPRIGFHGTLTEEKLDVPLLAELARRRPEWSFVLVGPEKGRAVRRALGTLPNVSFAGLRSASELPACLASFDVLLIPYRRAGFIGTPLKVYEALAAGLPVVATGIPELAGELGVTVVDQVAQSVEDAIAGALAAPREPVPLELLERYSWESKARRQWKLVQELAAAPESDLLPGISVAMSAHNEERAIAACLDSVRWVDEVVVVDSGSTDATAEIARSAGARVLSATNKLMLNVNKNLAIDEARHEWVLLLDPDERVSEDLAAELRAAAASRVAFDALWLPRRDRELGHWLPGESPQLRFFRNGRARFPCRHIHEMVELDGEADRASGLLLHEPRQSLFEYVHKRNLYSEHRARFLHEHGARFRLHRLLLRPPVAFGKSYLWHGGWRSGVAGLIVAASAAYGTFLQDAKLWQLVEQDEPAAAEGG